MGAHERVPRRVVTRPLVGCASSAVSQISVHVSVRSQDHDTTVQGCRAMSYIAMQMTCPLGEADELYKMRSKVRIYPARDGCRDRSTGGLCQIT